MKHIEFETKYNVTGLDVSVFKTLLNSITESRNDFIKLLEFYEIYDDYYTRGNDFIRHRYAAEYNANTLTCKQKKRENNNIIRKEINLDLKHASNAGIERAREFIDMIGFKHNFSIFKPKVIIYEFEDVFIPFYEVQGDNGKEYTFVEIEIKEDKIHKFTEEQAWDIIKEWEQKLEPMGITYRHRMNKSIFEMFSG